MFINITNSEKGNNKGSSGQLVHYLDKEQRLFDAHEQLWFNGNASNIASFEVRTAIDNNMAKLMKTDAKFFLINVSPSQKELHHLMDKFGELKSKEQLKDEYAKNFHRTGVESHKDLLWFAKLEHHRYYNFRDKEVKSGEVKAGTVKPGDQWHIQIIVSRKDITNKIRLSPMNKSRGKNSAHSKKLGQFDRSAFKQSGEVLFDSLFNFERKLGDTFEYLNTQKNGNHQDRIVANIKREEVKRPKQIKPDRGFKLDIPGLPIKNNKASMLESLLQPGQDYDTLMPRKGKKKKKQKGQEFRL
jgi:hypothetical protein